MTGSRLVSWLARGVIIASASLWAFLGCSRQSEGERCDKVAAGDTDCNEGLFCIPCAELNDHVVDRCCPKQVGAETTAACQRSATERPDLCNATASVGGAGGRGMGGMSGSGGTSASGGMSGGMSGSGGTTGVSGEGGAADTGGSGGSQ